MASSPAKALDGLQKLIPYALPAYGVGHTHPAQFRFLNAPPLNPDHSLHFSVDVGNPEMIRRVFHVAGIYIRQVVVQRLLNVSSDFPFESLGKVH